MTRLLSETLAAIGPLDGAAMEAARARQRELTKPEGSLGRLEELAVRLAGISGLARPRVSRPAIITMAGDHGVACQGVSAYPPEVTPQMVANFLSGGAAINVLARQVGARVVVADFGVATPGPVVAGLVDRRLGLGTANFARGPAMSREQATAGIEAGVGLVEAAAADGADLVVTGEMGIGNTTAASAI
ncbi:MAG TPA: nicotinate-nucleotide--dimethylbenzimidazole phosphoribosyltransferase, partial [Roseiflexaceae bacterium]|nr:nicotinate-nucleotide--dimethylbenzimidazole phosphoribosyltransferase [Roseiflexaceae bacterium]